MAAKTDTCGDVEDHDLVLLMTKGDRNAFGSLYHRHSASLLAFLRSRSNRVDADDIHQEVWVKLREKPPTDARHQLRGWLFMVARNKLVDFYRDKKGKA